MSRFTHDDVQAMIDTTYAEMANRYYDYRRDVRALYLDDSAKFSAGGNVNRKPGYADLGAANDRVAGGSISFTSAEMIFNDLDISSSKYKAFEIDYIDLNDVMDKYDFIGEQTFNAVVKVANALEDKITALYSSFTNSVGDSLTKLTKETIQDAKTKAERNNIYDSFYTPFLNLSPEAEANLLKDLGGSYSAWFDITNGAFNGNGLGAGAKQSRRGMIYDLPVFVSNHIHALGTGANTYSIGVLATKEAIRWASRPVWGISNEGVGIRVLAASKDSAYQVVCEAQMGACINRDTDGAVAIISKN